MNRVVIKVGSQTIVDVHGALNLERLQGLVRQIAELKVQGFELVLVTSGAVASGTGLVSLNCESEVVGRQILASLGQAKLIEAYNRMLHRYDLLASQILLTKADFDTPEHEQNIACLFKEILGHQNIVPIVNENDTVAVTELMFTDNDELASIVAQQIGASRLLIVTNVDGVYDRDPAEPGAKMMHVIHARESVWPEISASKSSLGRGGMQSKLATAKKMASVGIHTHIVSANEPDVLCRVLLKKELIGTEVMP